LSEAGEPSPGETWQFAGEVAVEIGFNGRAWTVMMASPSNVEDLAVGLALSEGVLTPNTAVEPVTRIFPEGIALDLEIPREAEGRLRQRTLGGVTGCGLCGVESLALVNRETTPLAQRDRTPLASIARAFAELGDAQVLNKATHSVHAAAWADAGGAVQLVREDVGRHNALDKLIGAAARGGVHLDAGFIVMTSRCSFELVQKCAVAGVGLLATLSAPTAMAIDVARAAGIRLVCRAGEDEFAEVVPGEG
jgi:FdhD protein